MTETVLRGALRLRAGAVHSKEGSVDGGHVEWGEKFLGFGLGVRRISWDVACSSVFGEEGGRMGMRKVSGDDGSRLRA